MLGLHEKWRSTFMEFWPDEVFELALISMSSMSRRHRRGLLAAIIGTGLLTVGAGTANAAFLCNFEGYEGSGKFLDMMQRTRTSYDVRLGLGHFGKNDVHKRLQTEAGLLRIDPNRTPLVNADFGSGKIDLFYCASKTCTRSEIESESLRACMSNLGARSCRTYAIRVDQDLVCTVMPGLNNG